MKLMVFIMLLSSMAQAREVRGYYRDSGTYVAPYQRTAPDTTIYNNNSYTPPTQYNDSLSKVYAAPGTTHNPFAHSND